jgi:hypothetical protein
VKVSDISILKRLILQARPFWGRISFIYLLNFLAIPLALLTPLPLMLAVDSVIGTKPLPEFLQLIMPNSLANGYGLLLAIIAFTLLLALLGQLQSLLLLAMQTEAGEKMVLQFRARLFRHAQMLSLNYHDSRGTVDAVYRIQYDTPSIQWIVLNGITPLITALFTAAFAAALEDSEKARVLGYVRRPGSIQLAARGQGIRTGIEGRRSFCQAFQRQPGFQGQCNLDRRRFQHAAGASYRRRHRGSALSRNPAYPARIIVPRGVSVDHGISGAALWSDSESGQADNFAAKRIF